MVLFPKMISAMRDQKGSMQWARMKRLHLCKEQGHCCEFEPVVIMSHWSPIAKLSSIIAVPFLSLPRGIVDGVRERMVLHVQPNPSHVQIKLHMLAHCLSCSIPNRVWTSIGLQPRGWGPLLYIIVVLSPFLICLQHQVKLFFLSWACIIFFMCLYYT